ncbi:MAG: hypothetical protein RL375_852 [Pseudomonadota bacterium]|jgi:hypothetical protein
MSAGQFLNICAACGAEESLDGLLARMIDDDQVRRLVADVLTQSLPLGGQVVSYLRLHKPARQRLRMSKVAALLAELVPDIRRGAITRKGREWQAPGPAWQAAFAAVFDSRDKGLLVLPLEGNGYLYEALMRQADRAEAAVERTHNDQSRSRAHVGVAQSAAGLLTELYTQPPAPPVALVTGEQGPRDGAGAAHIAVPTTPPAPTGPSAYALKVRAEIADKLARRRAAAEPSPSPSPAAQPSGATPS